MFKKEIEDDHNNKPRTKLYKQEVLTALKKIVAGVVFDPTSPNSTRKIAMNGRRVMARSIARRAIMGR